MLIKHYIKGDRLPELIDGSIFHSARFFRICEKNPGLSPLMLVAYDGEIEVAHLLVIMKRKVRLIPPGIYHWCTIYGEGAYRDSNDNQHPVLDSFIKHLSNFLDLRYIFIKIRSLKDSRFAYRIFRENNFFPRPDLRIYNSLHDCHPQDRLSKAYKSHIRRAIERGVSWSIAESGNEVGEAIKMLRNFYRTKIKRDLPPAQFIENLLLDDNKIPCADTRLFSVKHNHRLIGCSVCCYSNNKAYLLYSCGLRKSHPFLYPGIMSIWAAITDAHERGFSHFEFIESGVSFAQKSGYLKFILNFGGKQVSTLRWFRFRWGVINKILRRIYV